MPVAHRSEPFDAVLIVAFGGPEGPDDVMPFLENVTRGRNIPRVRLQEVAAHYHRFGGRSPLNDQVRDLIAALKPELDRRGIRCPVYWGNRNWHPLLPDTVRRMRDDGIRKALAIVLSAYGSYSSCRQYLENIAQAQQEAGPQAPRIEKARLFYNHPDFIAANADRLREALQQWPATEQSSVHVAYTAHSIPLAMAQVCDYTEQLRETCRLVSEACDIPPQRWSLVYQSRSGRPQDPWLEPDIVDHLHELSRRGTRHVVVAPIGFLSDHIEVLFDLDVEARQAAENLDMRMIRAGTVATHPRFVAMLGELVEERFRERRPRRAVGRFGPAPDVCPETCCLPQAATRP